MNHLSPKKEMQLLIQQCFHTNAFTDTYEALKLYKASFGSDDFFAEYYPQISPYGPLVSLICLNCTENFSDEFISQQNYINLEVVRTDEEDSYADIIDYMQNTQSKYICFLEMNHSYNENKIAEMVWNLETASDINLVITPRSFTDSKGTVIAHPDYAYEDALNNTVFQSRILLETSFSDGVNLYGTLSTLLISAEYIHRISWEIPAHSLDCINRIWLLYQFLLNGKCLYLHNSLVSSILTEYKDEGHIQTAYIDFASSFTKRHTLPFPSSPKKNSPLSPSVEKHITFFSGSKNQYYNLKPIADEAVRRGYEVVFTDNLTQKAEIGVYCQHICYPEHSKFSLILLHDMAQAHNRWPNLWETERWHGFDIGILPGRTWAKRWSQCACHYYANPRFGTYELGYPKGDIITDDTLKKRAAELQEQFHLKYDFTILYAPSWENDGKEDDFIRALSSLNVNLLVKQADWDAAWGAPYDRIVTNIREQRQLHENKYENLYYIDGKESILIALELCDLVVSEESSVMAEALLFGKPSIAVTDWLIPDTIPSRPADIPMDYVFKCKKAELEETVKEIISHPEITIPILEKGAFLFSNQGHCCSDILDAIAYYTSPDTKTACDFLSKKLSSTYTLCSMWN